MNIILFEPKEIDYPLPLADERAGHILNVLERRVGDSFDAGIINGAKGKGMLKEIRENELVIDFQLNEETASPFPVDLVVGLSRPQTNRKILQEATSLGVRSIHFITTERGEPSYASSRLWTTGEWRRHLISGAAQAFSTRLPAVAIGQSLLETIEKLETASLRIALDNYEATSSLESALVDTQSFTLCIGSERGWTGGERKVLKDSGFAMAHLGQRPLRTETAVVSGVSIILSRSVWK